MRLPFWQNAIVSRAYSSLQNVNSAFRTADRGIPKPLI
jgi:hypothetical protein